MKKKIRIRVMVMVMVMVMVKKLERGLGLGLGFHFACAPKRSVGMTPGPEITWGENREMFDIFPLCAVAVEHFKMEGVGAKVEL